MRRRKQNGQIVQISGRWLVRYYERKNIGGTIQRKRVTHCLGPVVTRGIHPPADITDAAEAFMMTVNHASIKPERTVSLTQFVETVHLPFVKENRRCSTYRGYLGVWKDHIQPIAGRDCVLKNVICADVQNWLDQIGREDLARNTLARIQAFLSGVFKNATRLGYYSGPNPARDILLNPHAARAAATHAYSFEEITSILALLPEPAATVFALASFSGLRRGELEGLDWTDVRDGELHVARSIWNGVVNEPKTENSAAAVPIIPLLAERLELHRLRRGNPQVGPIFCNSVGQRMNINNLLNRAVLPALNRCRQCGLAKGMAHVKEDHVWVRDPRLPQWHGWHACRRGLGSNLYRLGVSDKVIQRILRHANVKTTLDYYVKTNNSDAITAMVKLGENYAEKTAGQNLRDTQGTPNQGSGAMPEIVN
jgi:integrase